MVDILNDSLTKFFNTYVQTSNFNLAGHHKTSKTRVGTLPNRRPQIYMFESPWRRVSPWTQIDLDYEDEHIKPYLY